MHFVAREGPLAFANLWETEQVSVRDKPHYTLPAAALAEWIEDQPDKWWSVDGDPVLTSVVDFPCPGDELAPAIRRVGKDLLLQDIHAGSQARGEFVGRDRLNELADTRNRWRKKIFLLSWADSDVDWLLIEDEALVPR
jgi:hypothetical protein